MTNKIQKVINIINNKQYAKIDGVMIDLFTANAIKAVWENISENSKAKYARLPIQMMAGLAYEVMGRTK